jgi:hypothetical protein
MSKGQQRSNREAKKPKKEKPKVVATAGMSSATAAKPNSFSGGKKKG